MVVAPSDDLGLVLRARREASGRTLREIADVTKLGVRTLDALERNQIERLPPGIFRRSVVRAYAREVGLDPEVILAAFLERHPDRLPPPGRHTGPVADAPLRLTRVAGITPWLLVGLLVAFAAVVAIAMVTWSRFGASRSEAPPAFLERGRQVQGTD